MCVIKVSLQLQMEVQSHTKTAVRCFQPTSGFELSKNKWGVDICLFIVIVIVITHRRFSIINNGGG
jgi:hypothetical protein